MSSLLSTPRVEAPSWGLFAIEPLRAVMEYVGMQLMKQDSLPKGDGHPVVIFPGFAAERQSLAPLQKFCTALGYTAYDWGRGVNTGPHSDVDGWIDELAQHVGELTSTHRRRISLIGWSLGGIYARELARRNPVQVRQVITLGSPFALTDPRQSHADGAYQRRAHLHAAGRLPSPEEMAKPITVPSTAVYSRRDGIVSWRACIAPETSLHENVEVRCGHLGFGTDPATLWLIADRLAAPVAQRQRFRPPASLRLLYPGR
jgi:Alpha/beta hydrolase family